MSDRLMQSPRLYAMFLLWLMSELFEQLPGGRRPGQAGAGLLLRRGAPALHRRAEGAGRQGGAGGAADPLQGRRRLLLHPEPRRRARRRAGPARQPRPACAARLHPARRQGAEAGGRDLPAQPGVRHRDRDPRGRHRRGRGLAARGQGRAGDGQPHADPPAASRAWARSPRPSAPRPSPPRRWPGRYDTAVDRESAQEILAGRAEKAAAGGGDGRGDAEAGARPARRS